MELTANSFISRGSDRAQAKQADTNAELVRVLTSIGRTDLIPVSAPVPAPVPTLASVPAPTPVATVSETPAPTRVGRPIRMPRADASPAPDFINPPSMVSSDDPVIRDGTYTLQYQDGSHFTFKIETPKQGSRLIGKTVINYMYGRDNETDFKGFAFLNPNGTIYVWKSYQNGELVKRAAELEILFRNPDQLESAGIAYAVQSGRCRRCNRILTVPSSIYRGYGAECSRYVLTDIVRKARGE